MTVLVGWIVNKFEAFFIKVKNHLYYNPLNSIIHIIKSSVERG